MMPEPFKIAASPAEQTRASVVERIHHLAVCLDGSITSERTLAHAMAVARAFGARVSLLHVLEPPPNRDPTPADPLDWELARREAQAYLAAVAERSGRDLEAGVEVGLVEGEPAVQIRQWVENNGADLVVLCTHGRKGTTEWRLASTARKLVESLPCSLLMVPSADGEAEAAPRHSRVLVLLDGSVWSETALSPAMQMARVHGAELVLVHAVPRPELTCSGQTPPSAEDVELERRLCERNARVARRYLERLRSRSSAAGIGVRVVLTSGGDVRSELLQVITRERPTLIVASTCGGSGHVERACGTVAMHLLTHAGVPLLLMRPSRDEAGKARQVLRPAAAAPRLPTQATP